MGCWSGETSALWSRHHSARGRRNVTALVRRDHFEGDQPRDPLRKHGQLGGSPTAWNLACSFDDRRCKGEAAEFPSADKHREN